MKQVLLLLLLLTTVLLSHGQGNPPNQQNLPYDSTAPVIYYDGMSLDSIGPQSKDTVEVFMLYVDTTMTTGSKTVKVGNVWKIFYYKFPVDPKTYWKKGYAVMLKKDATAIALMNDNTGEYEYIGYIAYLDEVKQPIAKKYFVMYTKALHYDYGLPKLPF